MATYSSILENPMDRGDWWSIVRAPIGSHSPFCPPLHLSSPREAPVSSLSLWICHSGHFTSMKQATGGFLWLAFFLLSIVFSRFVPVVAPSMGFSRQEYRSGVPLPSPCLYTEGCSARKSTFLLHGGLPRSLWYSQKLACFSGKHMEAIKQTFSWLAAVAPAQNPYL